MKKLFVSVLLMIIALSSVSFAQVPITLIGVGSRYIGMGGTGIALSDDICSAYFNPAGLMRSTTRLGEVKLSLGASYNGIDKLISAASSSNPAQFLVDNYGNSVDINGSINGLVGVNVNKIGISVIPIGTAFVNKTQNSYAGTFSGDLVYATVLTLGKAFTAPFLPFASIQGGANIKLISGMNNSLTMGGSAPNLSGTELADTASGFGLDLGAQTNINIPALTDVTFGVVARNLFQTVNFTDKSTPITVNTTSGTITRGSTTQTTAAVTSPTVYGMGIAGKIPGFGTILSSDYEIYNGTPSNSYLHIGAEQAFIPFILTARAGMVSGADASLTTLGATLFSNLTVAMVMDGKNSKNNAYDIDMGLAF